MTSERAIETATDASGDFRREAARSTPVLPLTSPTFTKYHLAMHRGAYEQTYLNIRRALGRTPANLRMVEILEPTSEDFLYQLQRVGKQYGWDKRRKYQPEHRAELDEMIARPDTRLYIFKVDSQDAGFCLMTGIVPPKTQSQGIVKEDALNIFRKMNNVARDAKPVEIYKIGLYDEFTGKGLGNFFLGKILHLSFEREKKDIVYLDTRDTNHRGVLDFYARNGMGVFFTERLNSDLIGNPQDYAEPDDAHREVPVPNGDSHLSQTQPLPTVVPAATQ